MIEYQLTPVQQRVMVVPAEFDVFLGGGRGGGKSTAIALLIMRHLAEHGAGARALYLRQSYRGAADFSLLTQELFPQAFPGARFNATDGTWKFPGGGTLEIGQMRDQSEYSKFQGRSMTLIAVDEAGQFGDPRLIDLLRSNLRAGKGIPTRFIMAANPGGPGHQWLASRYVFGNVPWKPFTEKASGRQWVHCPSVFADNQHLDARDYGSQLAAACASDPELLASWVSGDWTVARGAYFASVLDESRVAVDPWPMPLEFPQRWVNLSPFAQRQLVRHSRGSHEWDIFLSHDFGISAPSVTYLVARSPGAEGPCGRWFPRGSLVLADELATCDWDNLNKGTGATVPDLAHQIRRFCESWGVEPTGVADDAIFSRHGGEAGTIAREFADAGVRFDAARKGSRVAGWEAMRRMLADAGQPDKPGMFVSRLCRYWWQTVPFLVRDARRVDDVDSKGPDHGADAARYALGHERQAGGVSDDLIRWA